MDPKDMTFDDLWRLYMPARVTVADYAAAGWDMARILGGLRAEELSSRAMMDVANEIAAGLEERGVPMTYQDEQPDRAAELEAILREVWDRRASVDELGRGYDVHLDGDLCARIRRALDERS
jgi:hypothetical protein